MNFACEVSDKGLYLWPHEELPNDIEAAAKSGMMRLECLKFDKMMSGVYPAMWDWTNKEKIDTLKQSFI